MATFGEIIYAALDILKERADDAYYTEEHMLFLAKQMRAVLLERKYSKSRNKAFASVSSENTQQICLTLSPADLLPGGCSGAWLRSDGEVPDTLDIYDGTLTTVSEMLFSPVTLIPAERMPYVGHNKWLLNIIYAAIASDNHLYLTSANSQFLFLKKVKMEAVFSDPEKAAEYSCDPEEGAACDILNTEFPLEAALVPSCIELMVQEIMGSKYVPEDKNNNAADDLTNISLARRPAYPVETARRRSNAQAQAEE